MQNRYVEVTYKLSDTGDKPHFRAVIIEADSPRAASIEAKRNTMRQHPDATEIEEFMQRTVSDEKAREIKDRMNNNTWEGWFEESRD